MGSCYCRPRSRPSESLGFYRLESDWERGDAKPGEAKVSSRRTVCSWASVRGGCRYPSHAFRRRRHCSGNTRGCQSGYHSSDELTVNQTVSWLVLAPRNVLLGVLWLYRRLISPLYGQVCRYYPSCSTYAVGAIQYHGALWGAVLSAWRILRCNPWSKGGIDDPPEKNNFRYTVRPSGFVTPRREQEHSGNH